MRITDVQEAYVILNKIDKTVMCNEERKNMLLDFVECIHNGNIYVSGIEKKVNELKEKYGL